MEEDQHCKKKKKEQSYLRIFCLKTMSESATAKFPFRNCNFKLVIIPSFHPGPTTEFSVIILSFRVVWLMYREHDATLILAGLLA